MREDIAGPQGASSRPMWETLEGMVREKAQEFIQQIMEEEVTELLGREKSERRSTVDSAEGYRNGYGKPRRLAMSSGTIMLRRPRVRGVEERFESRVLPLFARRTKELGALLPELYLHGLAEGDFELAMRGLLGEGAPLSKSSIRRLRAGWTAEFEEWSKRSLADREVVGEFKRSSQHLRKEEELRWRQASADGRIELCVRRWVHPVVPRWGAGSIGRGFGKKLLEGCRARSRRWQPACLPLLGRAGFANVVACHLSVFVLCRGATYRSSSEKRLRFFKPAVVAYVRSPGSCAAHRRRSRENCGGTQQREVETSSIEPRPPNGMPIGERSVRKLPNSLRTAN